MPTHRLCVPCGAEFKAESKPRIYRVCSDCEHKTTTCECGCGTVLPAYDVRGNHRRFAKGHMERVKAQNTRREARTVFCACGCGQEIPIPPIGKGARRAIYIFGHSSQQTRIGVSCSYCSRAFDVVPSGISEHNFCSPACYALWRAIPPRQCLACGGEFEPNASRQRFCSPNCWYSHLRTALGGDSTAIGESWLKLRRRIVARDGYACVRCGVTQEENYAKYKRGLHVHHKVAYQVSQDNSESNLETLCLTCHGKENNRDLPDR